MIQLRPYQSEALEAISQAARDGIMRQLLVLPTGCHRAGQEILMADGSIKSVENVQVGDAVMGRNSRPMEVLSLHRGRGDMVIVSPHSGDPFVVNIDHVLSLVMTNIKASPIYPSQAKGGTITDITVRDYVSRSKTFKHVHKLFRDKVEFFRSGPRTLPIDPYSLGLLLGDGSLLHGIQIHKQDPEIHMAAKELADKFDLDLKVFNEGTSRQGYAIVGTRKLANPIMEEIRKMGLSVTGHHKFIPPMYKNASYGERLSILAGLLDTDGSYIGSCKYDFISASRQLSEDLCFVARSVGLHATLTPCTKSCQGGFVGSYYRVYISGEACSQLPIRIQRKKPVGPSPRTDVLRTGFTLSKLDQQEEYFGFELDGDGRYLLGDFTVTHNSGKSIIFTHLNEYISSKGQTWVIVSRNELADQAAGHLRRNNPRSKVGIERAGLKADLDSDFIVCSVQSLGTSGPGFTKRIQRFNPERVSAVIAEEAHHFVSAGHKNILRYFGVLRGDDREDKSRLLVGVTATPSGRSDNAGLDEVFERIVYSRDIREMILEGWIAPVRGYRIETEVDLSGVKIARGDFVVDELERKVNTPERAKLVIDKYQELCSGKSAIAFTTSVRHSHDLCLAFRKAGITALPFSGQTPEEERKRLFEAHQSGEVKILASCSALGEGVDLPWAEVGLLCSPTKSKLRYTQSVGRLLRPYPAPEALALGAPKIKEAALILDFVDNSVKHNLCTIPTIFGLRSDFNLRGQSATEALSEIEEAQEKVKQLRLDAFRDLQQMRTVMQSIDLLKPPPIPSEIVGLSELCWTSGPGGSFQIVGALSHFSIRENNLGHFEIARHEAGLRRVMREVGSFTEAIQSVERMIPDQDRHLLKASAKWRAEIPSEKQIRLLARLDSKMFQRFDKDYGKFSEFITGSFSKGDVSSKLAELIGQRR